MWAEVCQTSERAPAEVLAARVPIGTAADNDAGHADRAAHVDDTGNADSGAGGAGSAAVDARLRFAAAVAIAAVRAAVEGWAAGDGTGEDPQGAAELAVAHLAALRDFPWDVLTWS
ncbi:hypothetical protein GCM10027073_24620 [Streptomyces chlorus]